MIDAQVILTHIQNTELTNTVVSCLRQFTNNSMSLYFLEPSLYPDRSRMDVDLYETLLCSISFESALSCLNQKQKSRSDSFQLICCSVRWPLVTSLSPVSSRYKPELQR